MRYRRENMQIHSDIGIQTRVPEKINNFFKSMESYIYLIFCINVHMLI